MVLPKIEQVRSKISEKVHVPIYTKVTKREPCNVEVTGGWSMKTCPKKYWFGQDFCLPFMLGFACMLAVSLMAHLILHNKMTSLRDLREDFKFTRDQMLRHNEQLRDDMREIAKKNEIIVRSLNKILGSREPVMPNTEFLECLKLSCDSLKKENSFPRMQDTPYAFNFYNPLRRRKRSDNEVNVEHKDKKKNRRNRTKTIETVAVQFKAYDPDEYARNPLEGALGPWESPKDNRNMDSLGLKLMDSGRKLEISKKGLYFIYSQVTYLTMNVINSYSINVISASDKSNRTPITTCSSFSKTTVDGEISCYTSVIQSLNPGDVVYLQQNQPNREINFNDSYTFIGLMFLGNSSF